MNKQLKILAKQAGFTQCTPTIAALLDKFGKSIIAECNMEIESVSVGDYISGPFDEGYNAGLVQAVETINEHFGI
jgi:hypothetical protein